MTTISTIDRSWPISRRQRISKIIEGIALDTFDSNSETAAQTFPRLRNSDRVRKRRLNVIENNRGPAPPDIETFAA
jgi:hypothetical protein